MGEGGEGVPEWITVNTEPKPLTTQELIFSGEAVLVNK